MGLFLLLHRWLNRSLLDNFLLDRLSWLDFLFVIFLLWSLIVLKQFIITLIESLTLDKFVLTHKEDWLGPLVVVFRDISLLCRVWLQLQLRHFVEDEAVAFALGQDPDGIGDSVSEGLAREAVIAFFLHMDQELIPFVVPAHCYPFHLLQLNHSVHLILGDVDYSI